MICWFYSIFNKILTIREVSERLVAFVRYKEIGQVAFEKETGLSRGYVQKANENMGSLIISKVNYPWAKDSWVVHNPFMP